MDKLLSYFSTWIVEDEDSSDSAPRVPDEDAFPELNESEEKEVMEKLGVQAKEGEKAKDVIFGTLRNLGKLGPPPEDSGG